MDSGTHDTSSLSSGGILGGLQEEERSNQQLTQDVALNTTIDGWTRDILVFPAASRPSIRMRISLLPKIFAIAFESGMPISF